MSTISVIVFLLLVVAGVITAIVWWARGGFRRWAFAGSGGLIFVVIAANAVNGWPSTLAGLQTAQPFLTQVLISVAGTVVGALFAGGAAGLLAGTLHPRVGGSTGTPFGRTVGCGMGLGALSVGALALAETVGPTLSPPWASYSALSTYLPWLDPVLGRLLTFVGLTLLLLLGAVILHRWTRAGQRRVLLAAAAAIGLGFVAAGLDSSGGLGRWAVTGAVLAGLLGGGYVLVARRDRAVIPMVGATVVSLWSIEAIVTAGHPYAVPGEILALVLVLGGGVYWTHVLRASQRAIVEHENENTEQTERADGRRASQG